MSQTNGEERKDTTIAQFIIEGEENGVPSGPGCNEAKYRLIRPFSIYIFARQISRMEQKPRIINVAAIIDQQL